MYSMAQGRDILNDEQIRARLIVATVVILVLLALGSAFIPRGSLLNQCLGTWIPQNKYNCLGQLALESLNASVCSYLPGQNSYACYSAVAEKTGNATTCSEIANSSQYDSCVVFIANATDNYSECGLASSDASSGCYMQLAIRGYNQSACAKTGSFDRMAACSSAIDINKALVFKNSTYCASASNDTNRSVSLMTLENLSYGSNGGISYTGVSNMESYESYTLNQQFTSRDACYVLFALQASNSTYCTRVSNSNLATFCTSLSSRSRTNGTSLNYTQLLNSCQSVSSAYKQTCIESITIEEAIGTRNATLCTTLQGGNSSIYQCYLSLAERYNDTAYCGLIKNATANSACVQDMHFNASRVNGGG